MGYDTPMAISGYLGALLVIMLVYPFLLVAINIAIYSPSKRKRATTWFNFASATIALILLVFHMQTEVIFGKELLDQYYRDNPPSTVSEVKNAEK
ncbi:membrane protein [Vibrio galatheae]|uniref:Membrane protein n=1 Tax=Vibrio galatheae TaxID=579748 RepID=A0A0F4NEM8_9VIBR|nr:hypothetical protein [Vibrio galatheae]KJY81562.1 membrane protein [Vibrio galatheae]